jgi:hypothetical protein
MQTNLPNVNLDNDHASNQEIPEIGELTITSIKNIANTKL